MSSYSDRVRVLTEKINLEGALSVDAQSEFIALLKDGEIYADSALYDLLSNIWTLPSAFSSQQVRSIVETIIEAPFDKITPENTYVIGDILIKSTNAESLHKYVTSLKKKKNTESILRFIASSRSAPK